MCVFVWIVVDQGDTDSMGGGPQNSSMWHKSKTFNFDKFDMDYEAIIDDTNNNKVQLIHLGIILCNHMNLAFTTKKKFI